MKIGEVWKSKDDRKYEISGIQYIGYNLYIFFKSMNADDIGLESNLAEESFIEKYSRVYE